MQDGSEPRLPIHSEWKTKAVSNAGTDVKKTKNYLKTYFSKDENEMKKNAEKLADLDTGLDAAEWLTKIKRLKDTFQKMSASNLRLTNPVKKKLSKPKGKKRRAKKLDQIVSVEKDGNKLSVVISKSATQMVT